MAVWIEVATQAWGQLVKPGTNAPLSNGVPQINTTVRATASDTGTVIAPADWKSDKDGLLPGFVAEGTWLFIEPDGTSRQVEAISGAVGPRVPALESTHVIAWGIGIDPTGATDSAAAIQAKLNDLHTAGGGTLVFPPGTFRIDGLLTIPNVGGSTWPRMRPLRITGAGYHVSGRDGVSGDPVGGTILDLRYNGASTAKIIALGVGRLEIDHLSLRDEGNTGKPFILTTGATLKIHHVCFAGFSALATTTCNQDAVIFGGTVAGAGDGSENSPFQGYGSTITDCYFTRIRRIALCRVYANAINIKDCWIGHTCGSNLAAGACVEGDGDVTNACTGNVLEGNHFETIGYPYPVKLARSVGWTLGPNGFYDPSTPTLAYYRFEAAAESNIVLDGYHDGGRPLISEVATVADKNYVQSAHQGVPSKTPVNVGLNVYGTLRTRQSAIIEGGNDGFTIQPVAAVANEGHILASVRRSAAQGASPGATLLELVNGGGLRLGQIVSTPGAPADGQALHVNSAGNLRGRKPDGATVAYAQGVIGRVTSLGAQADGVGFTSARTPAAPTGDYTLTFTVAFNTGPVVVVTADADVFAQVTAVSTTTVRVITKNAAGALTDGGFHFMAMNT